MSKRDHSSDEFGKPMSTGAAGSGFDRYEADMGAPSRILLAGLQEDEQARQGHAPSPWTIETWKIVVFFVVMFLAGLALATWVIKTGGFHPFFGG